MARSLPYPGFTWSFSQHAKALDPETLYRFLQCVAPFEGLNKAEGYSEKITEVMTRCGVLTANVRDGKPDAWRDYQQLLAELGLIYSTKLTPVLTITDIGQRFLAGELGFSELIGIQALRYQYPNGQKSDIQNRQRSELEISGFQIPPTLTELQAMSQILLKPGVLILRVLLELYDHGFEPYLSVSECQSFLLPNRSNSEWKVSLAEVMFHRSNVVEIDDLNLHSRRNFQDWFKLLSKSDYFSVSGDKIFLSDFSFYNLELLKFYCASQENPDSFWIPSAFDRDSRIGWFEWFGNFPYSEQILLRPQQERDEGYVKRNFIAGEDEEFDNDESNKESAGGVNLRSIDFGQLGRSTSFNFSGDTEELIARLRLGAQKRHAKTLLHDRIVRRLAEAFLPQGAHLQFDPNSVDLYASWPDGGTAIFEVKTVNRRSLQGRLRGAIGQVQEYAYRRELEGNTQSDRVVVLDMPIVETAWQRTFLTDHLNIGLICMPVGSYSAFAPAKFATKVHWLEIF